MLQLWCLRVCSCNPAVGFIFPFFFPVLLSFASCLFLILYSKNILKRKETHTVRTLHFGMRSTRRYAQRLLQRSATFGGKAGGWWCTGRGWARPFFSFLTLFHLPALGLLQSPHPSNNNSLSILSPPLYIYNTGRAAVSLLQCERQPTLYFEICSPLAHFFESSAFRTAGYDGQ